MLLIFQSDICVPKAADINGKALVGLPDRQVVFSINFASTLWMPALTGNFDPCLDRFTMGAAIFTILGCQTRATRMFAAVLALIVYKLHKQFLSYLIRSTVAPRFDSVPAERWESPQPAS